MKQFLRTFAILLFALPCVVVAKGEVVTPTEKTEKAEKVEKTEKVEKAEKVDTVSVAVEQQTKPAIDHRLRRQNRGIANIRTEFVPKGQWVFGGSVSYSTHSNDNYNFLIIEDIQSTGYQFKITPIVGYAYSRNSLVGVRFGYQRSLAELDNASLSITSLDNSYFYSLKHSYNVEALWRKYIPLGRGNKRFALFAEVGLAMGGSQSKLASGPSNAISGTYSTSFDVSLGVNPGISAFLTNNMAIEVNIGVLGLNYSKTTQVGNQVLMGSTSSSQMNFRVNIFSIGLGASFYL